MLPSTVRSETCGFGAASPATPPEPCPTPGAPAAQVRRVSGDVGPDCRFPLDHGTRPSACGLENKCALPSPAPSQLQTQRLAENTAFSRSYLKRTNTASRGQGALNQRVGGSESRALTLLPLQGSRGDHPGGLGDSRPRLFKVYLVFFSAKGGGQQGRRRPPQFHSAVKRQTRVCVLRVGWWVLPVAWPVSPW